MLGVDMMPVPRSLPKASFCAPPPPPNAGNCRLAVNAGLELMSKPLANYVGSLLPSCFPNGLRRVNKNHIRTAASRRSYTCLGIYRNAEIQGTKTPVSLHSYPVRSEEEEEEESLEKPVWVLYNTPLLLLRKCLFFG